MSLTGYANWAAGQVLSKDPYEKVQEWILCWKDTLEAIEKADGLFEIFSIAIARWEFLGGLYLGTTTGETGNKDARKYVECFLCQINQDYKNTFSMSGLNSGDFDFYSVFRSKTFHGYIPVAVGQSNNKEVMGWLMGSDPQTQKYHLQVHNGSMHVDRGKFISEFIESLNRYSLYLKLDQDTAFKDNPSDRWRSAFWARFRPLYSDRESWMKEGYDRKIPELHPP